MKKRILLSMTISVMIVSLIAPGVPAAPIIRISGTQPAHTVEVINLDGWSSLGIYGEDNGDDNRPNKFKTFCMESGEFFYNDRTYYADISTAAVMGGKTIEERGGELEKDSLDDRTAYLYTKYINGDYENGQYYNGQHYDIDEQDIQEAIWSIEHENGGVENSLVAEANEAVASGAWSGIGGVRVLNLWIDYDQTNGYSGRAQDQLVTVSVIPAPSAIMLSSIGLLTVRWLRRRKRL